ncbi:hypothetical protein [Chishuiella sp.]|uniref:hypothetical protein n=1 Tax=Chishuiella sp. TaxID=1969467 RepID=UPI0028AF9A7B|nr:hypothetical protein [Chishuiella sp.]
MKFMDLDNGNFKISDILIISRNTHFSELLEKFPNNKIWDIKNGYRWIYFDNENINEKKLNISICFKNENIFEIHFSFSNSTQQIWSEWTTEKELEQKNIYDFFLTSEFGNKRKYK